MKNVSLSLLGALILFSAVVAEADPLPGPTSGFSSAYVQVIPTAVADLPACSLTLSGARAVASDVLAPAYLQPLIGGGAVEVGALCNGTSWVAD